MKVTLILSLVVLLGWFYMSYDGLPVPRFEATATPAILNDAKPLISVIVPCYQHAIFLKRCITSLLQQTFTQFEILIIDDHSQEVLFQKMVHWFEQTYPQFKSRVQFLQTPKHGGLANTRNFAIARAKGEWILPLDADDYILPTMLEKTVAKMSPDVNMIAVDMKNLEQKNIWQMDTLVPEHLPKRNFFHCSTTFKRSLWVASKQGYNVVIFFGWEDWAFWLQVNALVPLQVAYVREPLFIYDAGNTHHFCGHQFPLCFAFFKLGNAKFYTSSELQEAFDVALTQGSSMFEHKMWRKMQSHENDNPVLLLWRAIQMDIEKEECIPIYSKFLSMVATQRFDENVQKLGFLAQQRIETLSQQHD